MSIRECINVFFDHVGSLEKYGDCGNDGYTREFKQIVNKSRKWIQERKFPCLAGENPINIPKNRYKDILPYDHSRVILPEVDGKEGSDYINANYVLGASGKNSYIASQGPQPATVGDFWRMLWHFRITVVIMACSEYEGIKFKCQRYWPEKDAEAKYFNDTISVTLVEENDFTEYKVRILQVACDDQVRLIYQLHYQAWPDHGTPTAIEPILDMLAYARQYQPLDVVPMVIHCSAGCGRTGTIIALDYTWSLLKAGKLTLDYSIYNLILEFRRQRPSLVQSEEQYLFVYMAVRELFQRHLNLIDEHFYENVEIFRSLANDQKLSEEDDDSYQTVDYPSREKPRDFNNQKFPSVDSLPDNAKTPEVPKLQPAPMKRSSGNQNKDSPTSPRGPPKPERIFVSDSPTNTTIRNTVNRLFSSSSETDSELYANVKVSDSKPAKPDVKPNQLGLNSISEKPRPGSKPSPTSPKPNFTNSNEPSGTKKKVVTPASLAPESQLKKSDVQRQRVKGLASNFEKSSSVDDNEATHAPLDSSTSNSSSLNTVFTSDKGSPSAVSDISVFSSDNAVTGDQTHSSNRDHKTSKEHKSSSVNSKDRSPQTPSNPVISEYVLETSPSSKDSTYEYAKAVDEKSTKPKTTVKPKISSSSSSLKSNSSDDTKSEGPSSSSVKRRSKPKQQESDSYECVESPESKASDSSLINAASNATSGHAPINQRIYEDIADVDLEGNEPAVTEYASAEDYAYAGVKDANKWSLQHIALKKPQPQKQQPQPQSNDSSPAPRSLTSSIASATYSEYSEATADDAVEVFQSSDEEDAPALPQKLYSVSEVEALKRSLSTPHDSSSTDKTEEQGAVYHAPAQTMNISKGGTLGRMFGRNVNKLSYFLAPLTSLAMKGGFQKKKSDTGNITHNSEPPVITYKGKVISFGNKVPRPKGGRSNAFKPQ